MKLVIGGAYQGKLTYAKETYHISEGWVDGRTCGPEEIMTCRGIHHFHEYVKRMLAGGDPEKAEPEGGMIQFSGDSLSRLEEDAEKFAEALSESNPELVVVSTELGCGVVPMEKADRLWREAAGRLCTCIAGKADEVVRVVCGIGVRIK